MNHLKNIIFTVNDMMCETCEKTITTVLSDIDGINQVKTDLDNHEVMVNLNENVNIEDILTELDNIGFPADFKKKL